MHMFIFSGESRCWSKKLKVSKLLTTNCWPWFNICSQQTKLGSKTLYWHHLDSRAVYLESKAQTSTPRCLPWQTKKNKQTNHKKRGNFTLTCTDSVEEHFPTKLCLKDPEQMVANQVMIEEWHSCSKYFPSLKSCNHKNSICVFQIWFHWMTV